MAGLSEHALEHENVDCSTSSSPIVPLTVRFSPPAFIQRRALVLATLRNLKRSSPSHSCSTCRPKSRTTSTSTTPLETEKCQALCKSLLDVGTGDGGLLSYLVKCDDEVPIERLVGFDPCSDEIQAAVANTVPTRVHEEDLRWRPLEISLYTGSVADVNFEPETFDVVTAIEVLEHLDPPDVDALSRVCLGLLQPSCFIVTTPNRDFNEVFRRIGKHDGAAGYACARGSTTKRYFRQGIEMRHHDHRFEMTRKEFEVWAHVCAERYGYEVTFAGVGTVQNAFGGQVHWKSCFPEDDLEARFGHSTQAAIFSRIASDLVVCPERVTKSNSKLNLVATHSYPWSENDGYPPTRMVTASSILQAEIYFRPLFYSRKVYNNSEQMTVVVDCKEFFEVSYTMRRVCRFDWNVCLAGIRSLIGQQLILPPETETKDAEYASMEEYEEPYASLIRAEITETDAAEMRIMYIFDITDYSRKEAEIDPDSLSIVSSEWADDPSAPEDMTVPFSEWYQPHGSNVLTY